jgi:hypothetical protein
MDQCLMAAATVVVVVEQILPPEFRVFPVLVPVEQ